MMSATSLMEIKTSLSTNSPHSGKAALNEITLPAVVASVDDEDAVSGELILQQSSSAEHLPSLDVSQFGDIIIIQPELSQALCVPSVL